MVLGKTKKWIKKNKTKTVLCVISYIRYCLITSHHFLHLAFYCKKNSFILGVHWVQSRELKKRTTRTRTNKKTTWWLIMYMATWYHLQWQEIIDGNIFKWTSWKIWIYVSNDEIKNIKNTVFEIFCPLNMPRRLYIVILSGISCIMLMYIIHEPILCNCSQVNTTELLWWNNRTPLVKLAVWTPIQLFLSCVITLSAVNDRS